MSILNNVIPDKLKLCKDFFLCSKFTNKSNLHPTDTEDDLPSLAQANKSTEALEQRSLRPKLQQSNRIFIYKNARQHLPQKNDQFGYNKIYGDTQDYGAFERFLQSETVVLDAETFKIKADRKRYGIIQNNTFFRDGLRRIDYILTFETDKLQSPVELEFIHEYIRQLENVGLEFELEIGHSNKIVFVKINIPPDTLLTYAKFYNLDLQNPTRKTPSKRTYCKCLTPQIKKYKMIEDRYSVSSERIWVINKLLSDVKFGKFDLFGIKRMLHEGYLSSAYPLHDGSYKWRKKGPYNIRQILYKHWGKMTNIFMRQPLGLIKKYYSFEVAFYFAWYGFYNVMLIPASIVGIFCFAMSFVDVPRKLRRIENEICNSDKVLCPHSCISPERCIHEDLSFYCDYGKITTVLEDYWNIVFAVFMSIWTIVFVALWFRRQSNLSMIWIAETTDISHKERPEFRQRTKFRRVSEVTGKYEPYIPKRIKFKNNLIVLGLSLLVILLVKVGIMGIFLLKIYFISFIVGTGHSFFIKHLAFIVEFFSSAIQVMLIKFFKLIFTPACVWLTNLQNPRTQDEFNQSVLQKLYILNFVNYYAPLLYLCFIEGAMSEFPGNLHDSSIFFATSSPPVGKILPVAVQLFCLLMFKAILGNMFTYLILGVKYCVRRKRIKGKLSQWEEDYLLETSGNFMMTGELMEMVIQFGLITFFSASFMLAPLCALINNVLEIRSDAHKINTKYRRPVPVRVQGIGAWSDIIKVVSYLGIIINAFVIAYATQFIPQQKYYYKHGTLLGFTNETLSEFRISDMDERYRKILESRNIESCYYTAQRYGPDHPLKYQLRQDYWMEQVCKLTFVLVYQHILSVVNTCISYVIPKVPLSVKLQLNKEKAKSKELDLLYKHDAFQISAKENDDDEDI